MVYKEIKKNRRICVANEERSLTAFFTVKIMLDKKPEYTPLTKNDVAGSCLRFSFEKTPFFTVKIML